MVTKRKPWPREAGYARDDAAMQAMKGKRALEPLLDDEKRFTEEEVIRRIAIGVVSFAAILRLLESVGAPTRPTEGN